LGRIPLDPEMVISTDKGIPFVATCPESKVAEAFRQIAKRWKELLEASESSVKTGVK